MGVTLLKYPNKSHRKIIQIPIESKELAELMGIIAGDGGINNDWQLVITLNSIKDAEYSKYVYQLLKKLFNIEIATRKRKEKNALVLVCSSINLLDFLISKGAVKGNKINNGIDVPFWIKNNSGYEKAFVRGLIDTDGCIYIHKHVVKGELRKDIGLCFTNNSKNLIKEVLEVFKKNGVNSHVSSKGNRIYLYGKKPIEKYLTILKSSNPRILNKYKEWRGARVADSACLESRYARKGIQGSNPCLSANY